MRSGARGGSDAVRGVPLVQWADTVDAARYASVEEALFGEAPALGIDRSLIGADDDLPS